MRQFSSPCYKPLLTKEYLTRSYYEFATPVLLINDVDLAKRVAISDFEHFSERRHNRIPDATKSNKYWNTFLSNLVGDEWKKVRGALSPAFSSGKLKYINNMLNRVREQEEDLLIDLWLKYVGL